LEDEVVEVEESTEEIETPETEVEQEELETDTEQDQEEPETPEGEQEPDPYTPDHKYKFMDQEFEFDDKIKGMIKTKEDEDLFRDFLTAQKAQEKYKEFGGIRDVETKLGELPGLQESQGKYNELNTELQQLGGMLQSKTTGGFQQFLQYNNNMLNNTIEQQHQAQRLAELDTELGNSEAAKAFDDRVGTPGSFRQAVIEYGQSQFNLHGRDVGAQEAVKAVADRYQNLIANGPVGTQPNPESQTEQTQPSNPEQTVVIKQEKTTIPNLGGGSKTPAKKVIKSIADIKAAEKALD